MSRWSKKGDLGRFHIESKDRPRFETIRANKKEGVVVWYNLEAKPQAISPAVFRAECTNEWGLGPPVGDTADERIAILSLRPGQCYSMPYGAPKPWKSPEDVRGILHGKYVESEAEKTRSLVVGKVLVVRMVRRNYVSCSVGDRLAIIPSLYLVRHGSMQTSAWNMILEDDD